MEFVNRYPEFTGVEPDRIKTALEDAGNQMSCKVWGKLFEQGHHALAAHLLYVSGALTKKGNTNGAPVQAATSKAAGGLSIGYSAPDSGFAANHDGYATSEYGKQYLRLRKLVGVHFLAVP